MNKAVYAPIARNYIKKEEDARSTLHITETRTLPLPKDNGSCEVCLRDRFKLTQHHLIPRVMHEQYLKQGLHSEPRLDQIAWLCRGCHEFVHKRIRPSVLARRYSSVGLLLKRSDVREWAKTLGKVVRKGR